MHETGLPQKCVTEKSGAGPFPPGGSLWCLSSPSPQGMSHSATLSLDENSGLLLSCQGCSCFLTDGDASGLCVPGDGGHVAGGQGHG